MGLSLTKEDPGLNTDLSNFWMYFCCINNIFSAPLLSSMPLPEFFYFSTFTDYPISS